MSTSDSEKPKYSPNRIFVAISYSRNMFSSEPSEYFAMGRMSYKQRQRSFFLLTELSKTGARFSGLPHLKKACGRQRPIHQ